MIRAFVLLAIALGASALATYAFGQDVLFALGLVLAQLKILAIKIKALNPAVLMAWLKAHALVFLRKDIPYKWISTVLVPLVVGKAFFRRIGQLVSRWTQPIADRRAQMMEWYARRSGGEKVVLTLSLVSMTLALSVTTVGLWLILFSVSLPLWVVSTLITLARIMLRSVEKYVFKLIAFLHLKWIWRGLQRLLPTSWIAWKRRVDFRIARVVVRRRRLTARQLAERKDKLPFRLGLMLGFFLGSSKGDGKVVE